MMEIMLIAPYPPMKAPEADYAYHLSRHLARSGKRVQVLTHHGCIKDSHEGIEVVPLMRDWSWTDLPRLYVQLRKSRADAVILIYIGWIYNEHPMITFAPSLVRALRPHTRFVTHFALAYGAFPKPSARPLRLAAALWAGRKGVDYNFGTLLRDSDRLLFFNKKHRDELAGRGPEVQSKSLLIAPPPLLFVLPEDAGSSRMSCRVELGLNMDDFVLIYFGYVYPGKGIEILLRAFKRVSESRPEVRLLIAGGTADLEFPDRPRYAQELCSLAAELGVTDKIRWTGGYPADGTRGSFFLRSADACVLPFDAGLAMNNSSFSAAVAHGLPVISTQGALLDHPIVDGENVLLCPPRNPDALAEAVERLVCDSVLRSRLAKGAQRLAAEWFAWERTIECYEKVLQGGVELTPARKKSSISEDQVL